MSRIEWDDHIALTPSGGGDYAAELTDGWVVGGGVNGGYLLAVIGNALSLAAPGKPDPIAVSAYYLSAAVPGPATVSTRVIRDGGSVATLAAAGLAPGLAPHSQYGRWDVRGGLRDLGRR